MPSRANTDCRSSALEQPWLLWEHAGPTRGSSSGVPGGPGQAGDRGVTHGKPSGRFRGQPRDAPLRAAQAAQQSAHGEPKKTGRRNRTGCSGAGAGLLFLQDCSRRPAAAPRAAAAPAHAAPPPRAADLPQDLLTNRRVYRRS